MPKILTKPLRSFFDLTWFGSEFHVKLIIIEDSHVDEDLNITVEDPTRSQAKEEEDQ